MNRATRKNKHKRTPIPGLAQHIAWFTSKREHKQELAAIRAAFADRVYAISSPICNLKSTIGNLV